MGVTCVFLLLFSYALCLYLLHAYCLPSWLAQHPYLDGTAIDALKYGTGEADLLPLLRSMKRLNNLLFWSLRFAFHKPAFARGRCELIYSRLDT